MKVALVTGICGQDGSYLSELLLEKGYTVYGMIRRSSSINTSRIDHIYTRLRLRYGDLSDSLNISKILNEIKETPNLDRLEIYNLGAMSHVKVDRSILPITINLNQFMRELTMTNRFHSIWPSIPATLTALAHCASSRLCALLDLGILFASIRHLPGLFTSQFFS